MFNFAFMNSSVVFLQFLFHVCFSSNQATVTINSVVVDSEILDKSEPSSIFLKLSNGTDQILNKMSTLEFTNVDLQAFTLVESLKEHSDITQANLRTFFSAVGVDFQPFWITNEIYIKEANRELIQVMLDQFGTQLTEIRQEKILPMLETFDVEQISDLSSIQGNQWGVERMSASTMWEKGVTGKGTTVAILDTGVRSTHQDLAGRIVAQRNEIVLGSIASDLNGHGTHCCGSIAGARGTGMAPQANIVMCKCCETSGCPEKALLACGQYVSCVNPGCANNPRIVSNSWGGGEGDTFYQNVVTSWRTAGMLPVFAAGNSGSACGTVNSPGDYSGVLSVGATDSQDKCASFSSRGPSSLTSGTKPEVSAPGNKIVSCSHVSDTGYATMSGTSMATPHVAGFAALLLSQQPTLTVAALENLVINSCSTNLVSGGETCGGIKDSQFPNDIFGFGLPSGAKAMQIMADSDLNQDTKPGLEEGEQ